MAAPTSPTVKAVLDEELQQVETSRNLRLGLDPRRPAGENLIGLAFSGGGIRSATFNLGILQALARSQLLRAFDYLSTVSGGGYIGGWLMAWMHHQGIGIQQVEEKLSASPDAPRESSDPPEVHFLRDYSNYLTPRKGLLGADFWAFAASYLRNTLLNQVILVLALLSLLMLPRSFVYLLHLLETAEESLQGRFSDTVQAYMESQYFALGLGLVLAFLAVVFIGMNLVSVDRRKRRRDCWFTHQWAVQALIVVPLFLSAAFFTYGLGQFFTEWGIVDHPLYRAPLLGIALYFGLWAGALAVRSIVRAAIKSTGNGGPKPWLLLATAAVTGLIVGYCFVPFARVLIPVGGAPGSAFTKWHVMTFGTPVAIGMMLLAGVLHIGLMGRGMTDEHREWWGRLGGWLLIYGFCWFFLFLIAVYFPAAVGALWYRYLPDVAKLDCTLQKVPCPAPTLNWEQRPSGHPISLIGLLAWIVSTAYGVAFGKNDTSGKPVLDASYRQKLSYYLAKLTPYVFILGLLMGLSLLAARICTWIKGPILPIGVNGTEWPALALPSDLYFHAGIPLTCVLLFAAAVILSWRVDINEFSIHYLYRNRLVRCYLGASVLGRNAQPFTGFSDGDNFPLSTLRIPQESKDPKDARPVPIVNTSLNVVRGKELALQTRKARSFAFTPLYGGFTRQQAENKTWESFFGPTEKAGCLLPGYKDGITLGTSIAISGAAASPNMGSYSEPPLAFLMTLFDVRLGWWIGNPAGKRWPHGSPAIGFYWLLRELLGATTDDSDYVYLSDGGHFENLALYELVRRRCKLIVACDASSDPARGFGDLHNAMERCRSDFGVDIRFDDLSPLKPQTDPADASIERSKAHFVKGTIRYNPNSSQEDGTIIYIKPSLVNGDPDDVLAYAGTNKSFPNDTTANQWFDETHFENYRALGQAAGTAAADTIRDEIRRILTR
ncbi:MAG TPA: patatin-like phospholipase family protein [Terriglobales bacterium]|nr:patatin-like phospholipase family protein [Terriglobales bacterium]